MSSWCTLESDPGVFTALSSELGVSGVEVTEVIDLDMPPTHVDELFGLIFLFKYEGARSASTPTPESEVPSDLWFVRQTIQDACGTIALLNTLMNVPSSSARFSLGDVLTSFREVTMSFPAEMRGEALETHDVIRLAHNSLGAPPVFSHEQVRRGKAKDAFHFVAYIPFGGQVWELDGLVGGPVRLGPVPVDGAWMSVAAGEIRRRMESMGAGELRFTLLGVHPSREAGLRLIAESDAMPDEDRARASMDLVAVQAQIAGWKEENSRRSHNYVPFALALLKLLSKSGALPRLVELGVQYHRDHPPQR